MPLRRAVLKQESQRAPASLNQAQLEAVHHLGGPCLVLAGAGSGKTRVIVHKIARLLEAGYAPSQIAAITFTNKAAAEMRERAKALVGGRAAGKLAVSTFHSLGVRMLREDGERVGLKPKFSILDSDDVLGVLKDAGGSTDNALARRWQWAIGAWKNRGLDSAGAEAEMSAGAALPSGMSAEDASIAVRVMQRYEERLAAYQAVDFDDLIVLPARLLARDAEVRDAWRDKLRYVLVDEYQDTNGVQYELMKLLAGPSGLFTAVGDDDQSIYGWRGATVDNLRRLPVDYPSLRVIALEQNYRSTGSILAAANAVISNNPKLFEKKLWSELGAGEPVRVLECDDEAHEADRAVAHLQSLLGPAALRGSASAADAAAPDAGTVLEAGTAEAAAPQPAAPQTARTGTALRDVAVLYRANHQARVFEQALRKAGIPYKVSGGQSFFDRAEIRDLCAWLRLLVNLDDDPAFLRAATSPKRGIGHQTLGLARHLRRTLEDEPVRGLVRRVARRCAAAARRRVLARVRPLRERPAGARRRDQRRRGCEGVPARVAEADRLRAAHPRRRRLAAPGRGPLEQRHRFRRLDRPPMRWHRLAGDGRRDRGADRARRRADHLRDHQPGRAQRRPERRHAVDAARGQGPRVAARGAGRHQRGPAALPWQGQPEAKAPRARPRPRTSPSPRSGSRKNAGSCTWASRAPAARSSSARWHGASAAARRSPACRAVSSPR